jgi:hypothetical protein
VRWIESVLEYICVCVCVCMCVCYGTMFYIASFVCGIRLVLTFHVAVFIVCEEGGSGGKCEGGRGKGSGGDGG